MFEMNEQFSNTNFGGNLFNSSKDNVIKMNPLR